MLLQLSHFFSPLPPSSLHPLPPACPLSSCTRVVHISSLASPLFLTFPCLFFAYKLFFLFPVPSFYPPPSIPPFMSMGHTYKFFTFSISYTILNLPLSIFYLPFMLLISHTFSYILPPSPLIPLHVISISVILFLF